MWNTVLLNPASVRMRNSQAVGVQAEPLVFPAVALNVADDRMSDEFAVNAKLIGAARDGFKFEKGCVSVSFTHPESGLRVLSILFYTP